MWSIVVVELQELWTLFCTYKMFIGCFCNVFLIGIGVRSSLWNGTQIVDQTDQAKGSLDQREFNASWLDTDATSTNGLLHIGYK